jgi:hypothetical protein
MYIITGYDVINGGKQRHKNKYKKVETISDIDRFENRVRMGYKLLGHVVEVYAIYKQKI